MTDRDNYRALSLGAKSYFLGLGGRQPSPEEALTVLRSIAAGLTITGVGFDDPLHEDTALRRLVTIAFEATPDEILDRDTGNGELWSGVVERFSIFLLTSAKYSGEATNESSPSGLSVDHEKPIGNEKPAYATTPAELDLRWFKLAGIVVVASLFPVLMATIQYPDYKTSTTSKSGSPVTSNQSSISTSATSATLTESANRMLALAQATPGSEAATQRDLNCKVILMTLAISQRRADPEESMLLSRCVH